MKRFEPHQIYILKQYVEARSQNYKRWMPCTTSYQRILIEITDWSIFWNRGKFCIINRRRSSSLDDWDNTVRCSKYQYSKESYCALHGTCVIQKQIYFSFVHNHNNNVFARVNQPLLTHCSHFSLLSENFARIGPIFIQSSSLSASKLHETSQLAFLYFHLCFILLPNFGFISNRSLLKDSSTIAFTTAKHVCFLFAVGFT